MDQQSSWIPARELWNVDALRGWVRSMVPVAVALLFVAQGTLGQATWGYSGNQHSQLLQPALVKLCLSSILGLKPQLGKAGSSMEGTLGLSWCWQGFHWRGFTVQTQGMGRVGVGGWEPNQHFGRVAAKRAVMEGTPSPGRAPGERNHVWLLLGGESGVSV